MAAAAAAAAAAGGDLVAEISTATRKEKRKAQKKRRRSRARREAAGRGREAAEALAGDPEEQRRLREREEEEAAAAAELARRAFEEAERRWLEAAAARKAAQEEEEEARRQKLLEASHEKGKDDHTEELEEGEEWEYVEEGPVEIIWEGNEIIVKKKRVKVAKKDRDRLPIQEDDGPTSNPLPPQSAACASQMKESSISAQEVLEKVAQETPNFGTEQDKAHCPFHLKTGACRFGVRCSRVHFYPDKSRTLLIKNMYNGPGLAWEQDEGLEYTDEEVDHSYEEFYEDVHTEFLKFGELVNFKVCRNGSSHLRGNVYVHYKSLDSAVLAYNSMNCRYFAGKQITCEFVAVTRWKAAICGEYMRSRLKTCSHGTACNFIHCFRNPGGDYEWADWDNPPPKFWIRKMAALFGPSDDSVYDRQSDVADFERPRSSERKRLRSSSDRHDSRRSRDEMDVQKRHSVRDDSHSKPDRSSHSIKREHTRSRRVSSAANKHRSHGGEDNTCKDDKERDSSHKHKYEERRRTTIGYDYGRPHRAKESFDEGARDNDRSKSRRRRSHRPEEEPGSSDWRSDFTDGERSKSPSSSKSSGRFNIDEEWYNGRQSSEDPDLERHYSTTHESTEKEHCSKRREKSKHHAEDDSPDYEIDGGSAKSRKHKASTRKDRCGDSDDRWEATYSDVDSADDTRDQMRSRRSNKLERNHRKGSRKRNPCEEDTSDSDGRDLSSEAHRSRSRSREENPSSERSTRTRSRRGCDS